MEKLLDIKKLMQPKERFDVEDGQEMLHDANVIMGEIDKRLKLLRRLAAHAASPRCSQAVRLELDKRFQRIKAEIDEWANMRTGSSYLLNYTPEKAKTEPSYVRIYRNPNAQ